MIFKKIIAKKNLSSTVEAHLAKKNQQCINIFIIELMIHMAKTTKNWLKNNSQFRTLFDLVLIIRTSK